MIVVISVKVRKKFQQILLKVGNFSFLSSSSNFLGNISSFLNNLLSITLIFDMS